MFCLLCCLSSISLTSSTHYLCLSVVIAAMAHLPDGVVGGHWYIDRKFTICVTAVLVILPLSIPKEIGFQKYARYTFSHHPLVYN
jgi:hypothetical protein